jgi:hypothetical protein
MDRLTFQIGERFDYLQVRFSLVVELVVEDKY